MRSRLERSHSRPKPPRAPATPLLVTRRVLAALRSHARSAAPDECMGLLASHRAGRSRAITHAVLLDAIAEPSRAVAEPKKIADLVRRLQRRGLVPRGFWHSHVNFAVHHSSEDDETMTRLLPGMADHNFERPAPPHLAPVVTAPDEAWLPLPDGTALSFTLAGPPIPGLDAQERCCWKYVSIRHRGKASPTRVVQKDGRLFLHGGAVVIVLGLPAGATLSSRIVEASHTRVATMYSLVINVRGETYAEALTLHDVNGRSFTEMGPCDIEVLDQLDAEERWPANGRAEAIGSASEG